ncbi:MAG: hypothetical protein D6689_21660 [Deltaproteobacteria bacterium]|nr:MAG: hypothetical protein D6689_21660 [Deltaproteobacteria bacterium]
MVAGGGSRRLGRVTTTGEAGAAVLALARGLVAGDAAGDRSLPEREVRAHRLGPLAYRAGCRAYRADYALSSVQAAERAAALAEAVAVLRRAGVAVAVIKGAAYAGWLYADPAERPMSDVDLLVRPRDRRTALRALAGLGYRPTVQPPLHHATALARGRSWIDLHVGIVQPGRTRISTDAVMARARPAAERADGALRLDPADEVLFLMASLMRAELFAPLLAFVDAGRLVRAVGPDAVAEARARARAYRARRGVDAALAMCARVLGEAWPAGCAAPMPRGVPAPPVGAVAAAVAPGWPQRAARRVLLSDGAREAACTAAISLARVVDRALRARGGQRAAGRWRRNQRAVAAKPSRTRTAGS